MPTARRLAVEERPSRSRSDNRPPDGAVASLQLHGPPSGMISCFTSW